MTEHTIGVDISKTHLDVFHLDEQRSQRFANTKSGLRALQKWLCSRPLARVVYEPTGPYHRLFEETLVEKLPLVKVNTLQARRFAQACGTRAKTDALDARGLSLMGVALALEPSMLISRNGRVLRDLQVARTALVKERTPLRNRAHVQTNAVLKRQTKTRLRLVEKQIVELDTEIANLIDADERTARQLDILRSVPGLGQVAAAAIVTFLPEIGSLNRRQISSLAGLVPHPRESGNWKGRSFISGGRKPLRDSLSMPALVAIRYNPELTANYESFRAAGKPAKVAIIAIMRKLIEIANALVKADRKWTSKPT